MARLYKLLLIPAALLMVFSCSDDEPLPTPSVAFFLDPPIAEVGIPVMFDNETTNASRYEWDFGDGNVITDISPTVTFSEAGPVTVTLRAFTEDEQMEELSQEITIRERVLTGYIVNVFPNSNAGEAWDPGEAGAAQFADIIVQFLPDDVNNPAGVFDGIFGDVGQGPFGLAVDPLSNRVVLTDDDWTFVLFDFDGDDPGNLQPEDVVAMIGAGFNPLEQPTFKNEAGDAGFFSLLLIDGNDVLDVDFTFELQ